MVNPQIHNVNVADQRVLISPSALRDIVEIPDAIYGFVSASRTTIEQIIDRQDHRLMVVVGPCSIHDPVAGLDYARRLKALADEGELDTKQVENALSQMGIDVDKPNPMYV